jgi:DNA-binding winged helix-turn-helix (wHTH) protein
MFDRIFLVGFNIRSEDRLIKILDESFHSSRIICVKDFKVDSKSPEQVTYQVNKEQNHPLLSHDEEKESNINVEIEDLSIINLPYTYSKEYSNLIETSISRILSIENFTIYESYLSNNNNNDQIISIPTNNNDLAMRIQIANKNLKLSIKNISQSEKIIQYKNLKIDTEKYLVTLEDKKIDLTFKELELLKVLASNPGRVFSRENLLKNIWDYDYYGGTRTVDVHVRRLRRKIEDHKNNFIETIWNVGYKFNEIKSGNINE